MKLHIVEKGAFRGLDSLQRLNLGENNLVSPPALGYISNVEELYLHKNRITAIPKDYFRGCDRMLIFDINFNYLLSLPEMSYISHSLLEMKLSYNKLRSLDVLVRSNWLKLQSLWVKQNDIFEIQGDLITKMSHLLILDIADNKLQSLPDFRLFVSSSKELVINVEGNPWYCDQTLDWVRHGRSHANFMRFRKLLIEDVTGMVCRGPPNMNGTVLWDMSKCNTLPALIARFMGPTWGPPGADKTQVGPMWATWKLLSGRVQLWGLLFWQRSAKVWVCLWFKQTNYIPIKLRNVIINSHPIFCSSFPVEIRLWMSNNIL